MIMNIVIAHFEFLGECSGFGDFYKIFIHDATFAVDFFFMISGFGMMIGNLNKFPEISKCPLIIDVKFGINHIKKIYPVYLATILSGLCWNIAVIFYKNEAIVKKICYQVVKLIVNIPVLQSATGMMAFTSAFNGVAWFLSCLFCVYLVSPFLMFVLRKIGKLIFSNILYVMLNILIIVVLKFVFEKIENHYSIIDILSYASPYWRVFYVLIGMNLALIYVKLKENKFKYFSIFEIIISVIVVSFFFTRNSIFITMNSYLKNIIDCFLCALFVFIFSFDKGCVSKILKKEKMQLLGNISMYIFLIHYPIRVYLDSILEHLLGMNLIIAFCLIFMILISTFVISFLIYIKRDMQKNASI